MAKPSEVMSAVTSRFDGREDELNANVTHFNIKTSEGQAGDGDAGAPDKCVGQARTSSSSAATVPMSRPSIHCQELIINYL